MDAVRRFKQHQYELLESFREHRDRTLDDPERLGDLLDYLKNTLEPQVRSREDVLYERLDELAGTPLASAGLRADHDRLRAHVDELRAAADVRPTGFTQSLIADQLQIFSALLAHHLHKEETILLPYLAEELSDRDLKELFESMYHEGQRTPGGEGKEG